MAIITEQRWKCDECGVVSSPAIWERNGPEFTLHVLPKGWVQYMKGWVAMHFCCPAHRDAWLAKQPQPFIERQS